MLVRTSKPWHPRNNIRIADMVDPLANHKGPLSTDIELRKASHNFQASD
jgi:hypothetical protein